MFKSRVLRNWVLAISALLIVSCSQYEKILKSNDFLFKYRKAVEYYQKQDYARASTIFEQILSYYRGSAKGDSVLYFYSMSMYKQEDYLIASHYFNEVADQYARSPFVEESAYMSGYCYYEMSPRPSLDQEYSTQAINIFQAYQYKYPNSKYVPECKRLIAELTSKLAEKSYMGAKTYYDLGDYDFRYYKASIIALRNCLIDFPENKHREEILFMLLDANYRLAENSVPEKQKERYQTTLDEYYTIIGEYPNSMYLKEIEEIYSKTKKALGI